MTLIHPEERGARVDVTGAGIAVPAIGSAILVGMGVSVQGVRVNGVRVKLMLMEESVQMALVLTESVQTAEVIWSFWHCWQLSNMAKGICDAMVSRIVC